MWFHGKNMSFKVLGDNPNVVLELGYQQNPEFLFSHP